MQVRKHADGNPTGVSVTWLGTSSGAPTLNRNNSGILLRAGSGDEEALMLVDAGMPLPYMSSSRPALGAAASDADAARYSHHGGVVPFE